MATAASDPYRLKIVEHLFRALTDINAEGHAIRRPQTFGQLQAVTGADQATLDDPTAGRALPGWRLACFAAGIVVLAVAIASPLEALAEDLVLGHMVQHLYLAVAPFAHFGEQVVVGEKQGET